MGNLKIAKPESHVYTNNGAEKIFVTKHRMLFMTTKLS